MAVSLSCVSYVGHANDPDSGAAGTPVGIDGAAAGGTGGETRTPEAGSTGTAGTGGNPGTGGSPGTGGTAGAVVGGQGGSPRPDGGPMDGMAGRDSGSGSGDGPVVSGGWTLATANLAGMVSECGNVSYVASRPDKDMLIASVALKGLWSSSNGGTDWTPLPPVMSAMPLTNRASTIVFDPEHPGTFWESGIYNGNGVYKSTDGGMTLVPLGDVRHNDSVSVDFTDPERKTLLAGGHEQIGKVWRSKDGGATWMDIGARLPAGLGFSSFPYIVDANNYLLGTVNSPNAGVFRSSDGGMTWNRVYATGVMNPVFVASDGTFYWVLEGRGMIKSADKGVTWTKFAEDVVGRYGGTLVELPDGRLVAFGGQKLIISTDKGVTWRAFGPAYTVEPFGLLYSKFQKAFFMWHFTCGNGPVPVPNDAIVRLAFDYQTQ